MPQLPVMEQGGAVRGVGGWECGAEKCRDAASLTKCIDCCGVKCVDVKGCAEFCLDWFGAKTAIQEMNDAAKGLQANSITDANERAEAVALLEKMQTARMPIVRRLAIALAKDLPMVRTAQ